MLLAEALWVLRAGLLVSFYSVHTGNPVSYLEGSSCFKTLWLPPNLSLTALAQTMEQETTVDIWSSKLLLPLKMLVKSEETETSGIDTPQKSEAPTVTASTRLCRWETYCLIVQVIYNVDSVLALDSMVPAHIWSDLIAWDNCTHWLDAPASSFTVNCWVTYYSRPLIAEEGCYGMKQSPTSRVCMGSQQEVMVISRQYTIKQAKIN